ncbi:hypothetical protein SBV1_2120011 [Verrucomicrobia bacterium]|nr:hypothetical protein SBV1_2120011 [Verrucomicrobiota bacterium]
MFRLLSEVALGLAQFPLSMAGRALEQTLRFEALFAGQTSSGFFELTFNFSGGALGNIFCPRFHQYNLFSSFLRHYGVYRPLLPPARRPEFRSARPALPWCEAASQIALHAGTLQPGIHPVRHEQQKRGWAWITQKNVVPTLGNRPA